MSKFLIIASCTFGTVFLLMAIVLYFQYKRQQKKKQNRRTSSDAKFVSPSTYAAPPPIPRLTAETFPSTRMDSPKPTRHKDGHLYSNHNYEDMPYDQDIMDSTIYDRNRTPVPKQGYNTQTLPSQTNVLYDKTIPIMQGGVAGTLPLSLAANGMYDRSLPQLKNGTSLDRNLPQLSSTMYQERNIPTLVNGTNYERNIPPLVSGTSLDRKMPTMSTMGMYPNDFSPSRSPPMLSSPVSDHYNMYKGEFRNFSPTPRTNSLRSQLRNQALHVYVDPPPPPPPPPEPYEYDH